MIEYGVKDSRITFFATFSLDKEENDVEKIKDVYCRERKKFLENQICKDTPFVRPDKKVDDKTESKVKISLDTAPLDDAIKKADELIAKLKTAQLLINYFKNQA